MKFASGALAAVMALGIAGAASATTTITMQSRYYDGSASFATSADYVNTWNTLALSGPTAGYFDQTLTIWDNINNPGSSTNIGLHTSVQFTVTGATAGNWSFLIGPDFGFGGTLVVDGTPIDTKVDDLWWAGDANNAAETLSGVISLGAGLHSLDVYGFEGCCNGGTSGFYKAPGASTYSVFTASAVPEAATWAMMLVGFGGMGIALRRRRAPRALAA